MYELSVIKVIDPSCFFCEILKVHRHEEYEQLYEELNMLYGYKYRNVEELKPASLSIGQLCMVFCQELKCWCRASLESLTCSAEDELVECFLLDHAIYSAIRKSDMRFPIEEWYRLPFRATKFKLHQIHPISLVFNLHGDRMDFRPTKQWDSAAVLYFHERLKEATKIKAQFYSIEDNCMSVYLYLTTKDSVLCVNDDLVSKNYAWYEENNSVDVKIENERPISPMVKELQSPGHQNGVNSVPLTKEEAQVLTKEMSKIVIQPILWSAWRCLDEGHTGTDQKMDTKSRHPQDEIPVLCDQREFASPSCQDANVSPSMEQRQLHSSDSPNENGSVQFKANSLYSDIHNGRAVVQEGDSQPSDSKKGGRSIISQKDEANALESQHNSKLVLPQKHEVTSGVRNESAMVLLQKHEHRASDVQNERGMVLLQKDESQASRVQHERGMVLLQKDESRASGVQHERGMVPLQRDESRASGVQHERGMVLLQRDESRASGVQHERGMVLLQRDESRASGVQHERGMVLLQRDESRASGVQHERGMVLLQKDESQASRVQNERGMVLLQRDESWASGVQHERGMVPLQRDESWASGVQHERGMVLLQKDESRASGVQHERGMVLLQKDESRASGVQHERGMVLLQKDESRGLRVQNKSCTDFLHKNEPGTLGIQKENGIGLLQNDNPPTLSNQSRNLSFLLSGTKPLTADIQKESTLVSLQKDKPPFLANPSGRPSALLFKDDTQSMESQNRSRPVEPPPLDNQHGRPSTLLLNDKTSGTHNGNKLLLLDKPHQPSSRQEHKVVTSPDAVPYSAWSSIESDHKLFHDVPESITAELGGHSKEKTCPLLGGTQDPLDMPSKEVFNVVQSPWPPLCNVDRSRRLSNEIKEKSIARIRTSSGNLSSSASNSMTQAQYFTKFLQFLNPTPEHPSEEENDEQPKVVRKSQPAVFVSQTLTAHPTLQSAALSFGIKKRLMATGFSGPNMTESYCWAPIAEGSDTIVISPDCSNPMCYIPPLLTYLNCASGIYKVLPGKHGPHVIVLCSTWNSCHRVYSLLMDYSRHVQQVKPVLVLVGQSKEEIEGLNFRKQWELVVTTPHCLLRCMEHHGLLLQRLCHLILDEVDVLFAKAGSQMSAILEAYKKTVSVEVRDGTSQQIVAVGSKWHQEMELLLKYTSCPRVIITRMEQAEVFANVQQILHLCLDCEKMSVLLHCLDFTPVNAQKIVIFTSSDEEAELVHKAVQTGSTYSLLLNRKEMHNFTTILEQWKKVFSHGTVLSLVVTDDYAPILDITDATCIIHYSFPQNTDLLNRRLFSLLDYVQSKIDKVTRQEQDCLRAKSVLLMTEQHIRHAVDVLTFLQQAQAKIPPELIDLTEGILQAREKLNSDQELCPHLKRFGYCIEDKFCCPNRHHVNPTIDLHSRIEPIVETDQNVTVLPLCIMDAACFYGRIVTKDGPYEKLATQLNEYYLSADNRVPARKVETNQLYALSDVSAYHRVIALQTKTLASVSYVTVQYIDQGGTDHVPGYKLLQLPSVFQTLPPQYLEFIICRVKPIDTEVNWDSKVTRIINRSIRGKPHRAKVVFNLGKTYWLDPMDAMLGLIASLMLTGPGSGKTIIVQISSLIGLSTYVYDLNVRREILATGMATDNPEHVTRLKALLNSAETPLTSAVSSSSDECITRLESAPEELQITNPPPPAKEGESDKQEDEPIETQPIQNPPAMSLHPDIKWFERGDTVYLAVKLHAATDQRCTFHPTRVLFSCHAGGNHYRADLDLCKEIDAEKCQCSVKDGEVMITLRKTKCESWTRLLTQKRPNVTYDYDQLEDSEDSTSFRTSFRTVSKPRDMSYTYVSESLVATEESESESSSD